MMLRVRSWMRDENGLPNEKSNSFALFIVLLPIIFGVFGLGIDVSRNVYIRNSLQNDLDLATVGAAAVADVSAGVPTIRAEDAKRTLERTYAINRSSGPGLSCLGDGGAVPGTGGLAKCWVTTTSYFSPNTITYAVREQSRNSFLPIVGTVTQTYNLTSTATLRQRTQ